MRKTVLLTLILPLLAAAGPASAVDGHVFKMDRPLSAPEPLVVATLISDVSQVAPGSTFRVGVRYDLYKKWHIYWQHPGPVGKPTTLAFKGSHGVTFNEVQQPAPVYFPGSAATWTNGYSKSVTFFAQATVPADAKPGSSVTIDATSGWLVCDTSCLTQENATMAITLPVGDTATPSGDMATIDAAQQAVPRPMGDDLKLTSNQAPTTVGPKELWKISFTLSSTRGATLSNPTYVVGASGGLKIKGRNVAAQDGAIDVTLEGKTKRRGQSGPFNGVVGFDRDGSRQYVKITLPFNGTQQAVAIDTVTEDPAQSPGAGAPAAEANLEPPKNIRELNQEEGEQSLALMLLFAFLGGLILNIMPCVLPVLSIKIFSLLEQSGDDKKTIRNHGLLYTAGVMVSFAALSIPFMLTPQSWGFQMQNPMYLAALCTIVFVFALSLLGVFEVALPGTNAMNSAVAKQHGYSSSFVYGIFAVLLGTPCTAPLLAPALAFFLKQSPLEVFIGLQAVGLGLAFPFMLLGFIPAWSKWLPKPGAWMETFKSLMGFLLIGTAVWLMSSMPKQITADAFMGFLAFLATIGLCAWIYGHWGSPIHEAATRWRAIAVALIIAVGGGVLFLGFEPSESTAAGKMDAALVYGPAVHDGEIAWREFRTTDVKHLSAQGYTVFIDFTASWCVTCIGYEETVIDTDEIKAAFEKNNVIPIRADFTKRDAFIKRWLDASKRPGVPVYLIVPADSPEDALVLPQHLTTTNLLEGLNQAGPSRTPLNAPGS